MNWLNSSFTIVPTGGALGAFVTGVEAKFPVLPEIILELKQALKEHHILIFKNQTLSDEQLIKFATYFGSIFSPPVDIPVLGSKPGTPPVVVVLANNAPEYGKDTYLDSRELLPHSDHQWTPCPSSGSMLYAIEVPEIGGDTQWINLIKAYAELDEETKKQIIDLKLITYNPYIQEFSPLSASYHSARYHIDNNDKSLEATFPHPLVRTHPESGKKILYLNCSYEVEIVGMSSTEGAKLTERLRQHITQPKFYYKHQWSVGDVVYWDNQCTLHYRPAFDSNARRVLKRISLAGSRPF